MNTLKSIRLNGLTLRYQIVGQGRPMLLVHGNGEDHRIFDRSVHLLKSHFTCYLIDSRGHGESSPVDTFHYREMAEDMLLFLREKDLKDVAFVGFSDGGIIGLLAAAMTRRITTLIVCGANRRPEGLRWFFRLPLRVFNCFRKDPLRQLMLHEPDITDQELQQIRADTLIVAGQHDLVKRQETDEIAAMIPHAREMILPGESHASYVVNSDKLGKMILKYMTSSPSAEPIHRDVNPD
ncbi:alpha/beta fold hydrolase [Pseudoramibacter porci]|uniref:Alpha/beta hydrolase n=1 Tax=Pseudoramibacter porci TaxID=2606631 RepID=A0A7X2NHJ4_9FIRM|nr:alpha/beta fold hydrolase [Pseudoramibacter porci]MSS20525.1 alpha/beta hydrolase [Pseudoramibacter porci]